jgi:hypothetical protein
MAIMVFQVEISDAMAEQVNAAGCWSKVSWGKTYLGLTMGFLEDTVELERMLWEAVNLGMVKLTRIIRTDSLNEAFAIGNGMGDESKQTVLEDAKSVSVGDVMVSESDGMAWSVARFGFTKLSQPLGHELCEYFS